MPVDEADSNLIALFHDRALHYLGRTALLAKKNSRYSGITWSEWRKKVIQVSLGLYYLGAGPGDRIAILSENRPEWTFADLGVLSLHAVVVPIYPTSSAQEIFYILSHAKVRFLFVSDQSQLDKVLPLWKELPLLEGIIMFQPVPQAETYERVMDLASLTAHGECVSLNNADLYSRLWQGINPDDTATIIYTSGTTGPPKGVMLSHRNFICNFLGAKKVIEITDEDIALSFLPLSHVFERLAGYYFMIFSGATIAYAESMQTVPEDMQTIRPTVAAAVPRFYEKVYAKVLEKLDRLPAGPKAFLYKLLQSGTAYTKSVLERKSLSFGLRLEYGLAKVLIFNKIKKNLGGRIRFFISGGAPLNPMLAEFFYAAGILILEGYGLTETSPVIAVNRAEAFRFGTVGKPIEGAEVQIAENGEILTKGPCVMKGYFENEEATREVIQDGWFHTGDVGFLDPDGYLKITDRIKDIIVTSGGKKVSPQNIEKMILQEPLFSQMVLLGDKRNYLVALIVPKAEKILDLARSLCIKSQSLDELVKHPAIYEAVDAKIKGMTRDLANFEQIKYFRLLAKEFTIASGELTPTMKIKRKFVAEKYKDLIDAMYSSGSANQQTSLK